MLLLIAWLAFAWLGLSWPWYVAAYLVAVLSTALSVEERPYAR